MQPETADLSMQQESATLRKIHTMDSITSKLEEHENNISDKGGSVDIQTDTETIEATMSADLNDSLGVEAAIDEAMDLGDEMIEKNGKLNDTQSTKIEHSEEGKENPKLILEAKENYPEGVSAKIVDTTPKVVGTEPAKEKSENGTGSKVDEVIVDDKTVQIEEETVGKISEQMVDSREVKEDQESGDLMTENPIVVPSADAKISLEAELLPESSKETVKHEAEVSAHEKFYDIELGIEQVEEVKPVEAKQQSKLVEHDVVKRVRGLPPPVPLSAPKTTGNAEGVAATKPCDLITKDMVPTMKEGRVEEALALCDQIEFGKDVTPLALLSRSRWLVKQGVVTLSQQDQSIMACFRSMRKTNYHLILFNDTFIVCKKKGGSRYVARSYCQRNLVLMSKPSSVNGLPEENRKDRPGKSLVHLTMLENHEKKQEDMELSFAKCEEREDWIRLFKTPASSNQQEVVFEPWDCPLVKVIHDFEATKPEEMTIHKDEKINIIKKCSNGFYEGERLQDQQRGYFPISATEELASEHSRALRIRNNYKDTTF